MWQTGDRVRHRWNAELGPGKVTAVEGRRLTVVFPEQGTTLQITRDSDALEELRILPGIRALDETTRGEVEVKEVSGEMALLDDGRRVETRHLWPLPAEPTALELLAQGEIGAFEDFRNRVAGLRLSHLREADGLGSFLGGRIDLYPHQLHAAERATRALGRGSRGEAADGEADGDSDDTQGSVRWLLADEVGLGKTVEACLIMNRLLHTGRIDKALVVAPDTLTVQWLGELWRKYHQVFVLLDEERFEAVEQVYGPDTNPFEVHRRAVISVEELAGRRDLRRWAAEAEIDLLVVDEAHHLRRPPGEEGNAAYRAVKAIAEQGRHVLLLTATPLEDDAHAFFRLLQLLRPDELPEDVSFEDRLRDRVPLPPCTSATRRQDIGGLPPRRPRPVELTAEEWRPAGELIHRLRAEVAEGDGARQAKADRVARALASPWALLPAVEGELEIEARALAGRDPRVRWLCENVRSWAQRLEKSLVFVAHLETVEPLRQALERDGRIRVGVFHEELEPERRDIEVARFRLAEGPSVLISTECGGEGRNFQFCHRLVCFDLPWHPAMVEQRIGRLDRIGRDRPTEIVYFRPPSGFAHVLVALYERIGLFEEPLGGLARELGRVARRIESVALQGHGAVDLSSFDDVLAEAGDALDRVHEAAYHELHRDPYTADMAASILERVPADLDAVTEEVVMRAAARFGFECEAQSGSRTWLIEYGSTALGEHLPGVAEGSRFLGTFDRDRAVEQDELELFASGHPLVEGILAELDDGPRGRAALAQIAGDVAELGLLAIYRNEEQGLEARAVLGDGTERPDLAERLLDPELDPEPIDAKKWTRQPSWPAVVKRLGKKLPRDREPVAVAVFRIRPRG